MIGGLLVPRSTLKWCLPNTSKPRRQPTFSGFPAQTQSLIRSLFSVVAFGCTNSAYGPTSMSDSNWGSFCMLPTVHMPMFRKTKSVYGVLFRITIEFRGYVILGLPSFTVLQPVTASSSRELNRNIIFFIKGLRICTFLLVD